MSACKYYVKEDGGCRKFTDLSNPMSHIEYCVKSPCPYEKPLTNYEHIKSMSAYDEKSHVCGECTKFIGMGDWNLCCKEKHDPKEYSLGFLCYEDTPACDKFVPIKTITEKQFIEQFCKFCGTQRCDGVNTEFFNGCIHRFYLKDYKEED